MRAGTLSGADLRIGRGMGRPAGPGVVARGADIPQTPERFRASPPDREAGDPAPRAGGCVDRGRLSEFRERKRWAGGSIAPAMLAKVPEAPKRLLALIECDFCVTSTAIPSARSRCGRAAELGVA